MNASPDPHGMLLQRREVREAAAAADAWEAEALPIPVSFEEDADVRAVAVLVTAGGFAVHSRILSRLGGEPADVAAALERGVVDVARELGSFPAAVVVRHSDVAVALSPALAPRAVVVRVADPLPDLEDLACGLLTSMTGDAVWPPVGRAWTWSAWRLPRAVVAELFAAAAAFWRAAPWRAMQNEQGPAFISPAGRKWTALVLGNGGDEFGLALYSRREDFERTVANDPAGSPFAGIRGRIVSITFDEERETDPAARREARDARWEIASPKAFPSLMTINAPGGGVSRQDAADLIAALRAVPDFVARHRRALVREYTAARSGPAVDYLHEPTGSRLLWDPADDAELGWIEPEPAREAPDPFRSELRAIVADTLAELGDDAEPDAIMAALGARIDEAGETYNRTPQPDLGGMPPNAVQRLLEADWLDPGSAMHVRRDLGPADLAATTIQRHALVVLRMAIEEDGLLATQTGNLRVAVVRALTDRMQLHDSWYLPTEKQRIIESDVRPLWLLRGVLEMAGLLHRRKGRFHATLLARRMVEPRHQAELYARLLTTWFRTLDIESVSGFDRWPGLQYQFPWSIRRFAELGDEWRTSAELLDAIILPQAIEQAPRREELNLPALLVQHRLLEHLESFGLAERTDVEDEFWGHPDTTWRRTDRLLRVFAWEDE